MNVLCEGQNCTEATGEVRLYPIGGGGNMVLCRDCWDAHNAFVIEQANATDAANRKNFKTLDWEAGKRPFDSVWEVLVGNIRRVYLGNNEAEARNVYAEYVTMSSTGYGRAAGENVTLMRDEEPVAEHYGTADAD